MSKKLSYHLLPISLSAQVLEWNGMWPGSRVTSVESDGDDVSCVPMVVLSVVAAILGRWLLSLVFVSATGHCARQLVPSWPLTAVFCIGVSRSRGA